MWEICARDFICVVQGSCVILFYVLVRSKGVKVEVAQARWKFKLSAHVSALALVASQLVLPVTPMATLAKFDSDAEFIHEDFVARAFQFEPGKGGQGEGQGTLEGP